MSRILKTLLLAVAGIVLLLVVSAGAILLLVDPNDFRDDIAQQVESATGRELVIEGDLSISVFPWLAVEMGRTRLGNAAGFGDQPFASFESARLSVRLLPLLLRREIAVGTAALDQLQLNLAVNGSGISNWQDLAKDEAAPAATEEEPAGEGPTGLDIASVEISSAVIAYSDAQAGSSYRVSNLSLTTGSIAFGNAFDLVAAFDFEAAPQDIAGSLRMQGTLTVADDLGSLRLADLVVDGNVSGISETPADISLASPALDIDIANGRLAPASLTLQALGIESAAEIRSLSWSGPLHMEAGVEVASFSPRDLLAKLAIEPPATADPAALGQLSFTAQAALDDNALSLTDLRMQLDETTLRGSLSQPLAANGVLQFDLAADRLNADRYMAPAAGNADAAGNAPVDDFEIPVELIRSVNARGKLQLDEAWLSGMRFTNLQLGLDSRGGKLRLNPLSAELFDGSYSGDVRIDASGDTPLLALNERISDVSLTPLVKSMFERDNVTGTIDGSFVLNARGKTLSAMRRNLNGNISFELADGAWQGVDLWHQLRTARAIYRRENPPERTGPARTEFSSVLATGQVTDGVFRNEDLAVEMPFLQVTGSGTVNLVAGEVDYALQARVLERPEFLQNASDEEINEFTEALIPVRVRGQLTDPSVRPDIEAMFRKEVEDALKKKGDELRDRLLERLLPKQRDDTGNQGAAIGDGDTGGRLANRLQDILGQ